MKFRLDKWYMDVVSAEGRARIAYAARVEMGPLVIEYASVLRVDERGVDSRATLRGVQLPTARGPTEWRCDALGVALFLTPTADPIGGRLVEDASGHVDWDCFAPRAHVLFRDGDETLEGTGYAELSSLTIPPWALPCSSLDWGRAHVGSRTLVWLALGGGGSQASRLFVDGTPSRLTQLDCERVAGEAGELLRLTEPRIIRQGVLGETVLAILPGAERRFPGRLLGMSETKWLSRARLDPDDGFAIHERVIWPARALPDVSAKE